MNAKLNTVSANADTNVTYRYERGSNGELIIAAAQVTITEKTEVKGLANRAETIEDPISISSATLDPTEIGLSDAEKAYLKQLQLADASVRNHEGLHFRAASGLGNLPDYQTVTGPDGNQYAVAGNVTVSTTSGANETQAARELQTLGIAATAPSDASAADLSAARKFGQSTVVAPAPDEANGSIDILA